MYIIFFFSFVCGKKTNVVVMLGFEPSTLGHAHMVYPTLPLVQVNAISSFMSINCMDITSKHIDHCHKRLRT